MTDSLKAAILEALRSVEDPEMHVDLVTAGMVKELDIEGQNAKLLVELTTPACPLKDEIERRIRDGVSSVKGLGELDVSFTAKVRQGPTMSGKTPIPGIRNIIAVASGKGGVGKSTVAVNLAMALAEDGARVGLMDADIYGPSVPKLVGLDGKQPESVDGRMLPLRVGRESNPVGVISMAFFLDDDQPVVWRGPMLHKALTQFFNDVNWGELDYLVIDLPPGTGDVQLSLSQLAPLTGAVIVTTPQQVALLDVQKAITMFAKVEVPMLGLVENMASFRCSECDHEHFLFGKDGGKHLADDLGLEFLGAIPMEPKVGTDADQGQPAVLADEPGAAGRALHEVARAVAGQVSVLAAKKPGGFTHELPTI